MKIAAGKADTFVARPDPAVGACLVYGPDAGLVRERADTLARAAVGDPDDPFHVCEIAPGTVSDDPARIADEMLAGAFDGGRRLVVVRGAGDGLAPAVAAALDLVAERTGAPGEAALLIVQADNLAARSALRKLFEGRDDCAAIACYPDDEEGRHRFVRGALAEAGVEIEAQAMRTLVGLLGDDRQANRRELEKLALYAGEAGRLAEADVLAAVGDNAAGSLDDAVNAAADGTVGALDLALERFWGEGGEPVALIRAAQRHFQRLHLVACLTGQGRGYDEAVRQLRPPVFWKLQTRFRQQVRSWSPARLEAVMARLVEAEQVLKSTGTPGIAACGRTLLAIAVMQRTHAR